MSEDDDTRSQGRKISKFPGAATLPEDAYLTLISGAANFKIARSDFLSALNVTGPIKSVGTGSRVLANIYGVHQVKSLLAALGIIIEGGDNSNVVVSAGVASEQTSNYEITGPNEAVFGGNVSIEVKLKGSPDLGDKATIIGAGGGLTVDGNGYNINGSSTFNATNERISVEASSTQWIITRREPRPIRWLLLDGSTNTYVSTPALPRWLLLDGSTGTYISTPALPRWLLLDGTTGTYASTPALPRWLLLDGTTGTYISTPALPRWLLLDGSTGTYASTPALPRWLLLDGSTATYVSAPVPILALYATTDDAAPILATPNLTANSITGDLTIVTYIQFEVYNFATGSVRLVTKGNGQSFNLAIFDGNELFFIIYGPSGTDILFETIPFVAGEGIWLRGTFDSTAQEQTMYTSTQPPGTALTDIVWGSAIGTESTANTSINANDEDIDIGGTNSANDPDKGYFARVALIEDTTGLSAPTFDMYPNRDTSAAAASWTSATGEVWTVDTGGEIILYHPDNPSFP